MNMATQRRSAGQKQFVSRVDAIAIMAGAALAAVASTVWTVSGVVATLTGPVTLTLPLNDASQQPGGLLLDATARFSAIEATIPVLPSAEAAQLAWAGVLNQLSFLAVAALLFLLAFRLQRRSLFTPSSSWIISGCGLVLAGAGSVAQVLDGLARTGAARLIGAPGRPGDVLFAGDFNAAPLIAGTVLVLVAGAFQFGRRLQKDTEGLI